MTKHIGIFLELRRRVVDALTHTWMEIRFSFRRRPYRGYLSAGGLRGVVRGPDEANVPKRPQLRTGLRFLAAGRSNCSRGLSGAL